MNLSQMSPEGRDEVIRTLGIKPTPEGVNPRAYEPFAAAEPLDRPSRSPVSKVVLLAVFGFVGLVAFGALCALALKAFHWVF